MDVRDQFITFGDPETTLQGMSRSVSLPAQVSYEESKIDAIVRLGTPE
jgi:hypothetical protein